MLSRIDRVDSKLIDCINMAKSTLQNKKQNSVGKLCGKPEKANPRLERMGPPLSGKPPNPSPKPAHKWSPEPTDVSNPLFDQDFDQFMESFDNLEPYDDLEDWSDNVDLFMDAVSHSPHMADILWEEVKLKKQKGTFKTPKKNPGSQFSTNHGQKSQKD